MGTFGKGRVIEFFMTDKDHKKFLTLIKDNNVFFIKDNPSKDEKVILFDKIPEDVWPTTWKNQELLIYNKGIGELSLSYNTILKSYQLMMGKSPLIQFLRSRYSRYTKTVLMGRISVMLTFIEDTPNGKAIEKPQPKELVMWWKKVSATLKKMCRKGYAFDPVSNKSWRNRVVWFGPDTMNLYKKGVKFQQNVGSNTYPQITFHPILEKNKNG